MPTQITPATTTVGAITVAGLATVIVWLSAWPIKSPPMDVALVLAGLAMGAGHKLSTIGNALVSRWMAAPKAEAPPPAQPQETHS